MSLRQFEAAHNDLVESAQLTAKHDSSAGSEAYTKKTLCERSRKKGCHYLSMTACRKRSLRLSYLAPFALSNSEGGPD
jgi:hypothetical protein